MPGALAKTTYATQAATNELEHRSEHGKASGDDGDVGFDGRRDGSICIIPGDVDLRQLQQQGQSRDTRRRYTMISNYLRYFRQ